MFQLKKTLSQNQFKDANDDKTLPVCWKGKKAFKSIHDVKNLFKPLGLSFTNSKNVHLQLSPEAYLIVSVSNIRMLSYLAFFLFSFYLRQSITELYVFQDRGNVCLGILNGKDVGLEESIIIGG